MEIKPKLSVTGYRAIWGKDLNQDIAYAYARAFARMISQKLKMGNELRRVLVGRDGRPSGPQIWEAVHAGLIAEGIEPVYAGILPTPSILLLTKDLGHDGGIMITASHNPSEYNGLKFILPEGRLTNETERDLLASFYEGLSKDEKKFSPASSPAQSGLLENTETRDNAEFRRIHIARVLGSVDTEAIKKMKLKVVVDPVNASGAKIAPEMLRELGCEVSVINETQNGIFAHPPEPLPENLSQIGQAVKDAGADIGFALDPDGDRLVLVDERGVVVREEFTIVLAIKSVLSHAENINKDTVVNLSTTRACDDVVAGYGGNIHKTKVGEANVVAQMITTRVAIGGEGSGGVIYPRVGYFRDALSGIALVLDFLARVSNGEKIKVSEIVAELPQYFGRKEKISASEESEKIFQALRARFESEAEVNTEDGVRFDFPDGSWLHVRASITEPIIRIFGEGKTKERIDALFDQVHLTLGGK